MWKSPLLDFTVLSMIRFKTLLFFSYHLSCLLCCYMCVLVLRCNKWGWLQSRQDQNPDNYSPSLWGSLNLIFSDLSELAKLLSFIWLVRGDVTYPALVHETCAFVICTASRSYWTLSVHSCIRWQILEFSRSEYLGWPVLWPSSNRRVDQPCLWSQVDVHCRWDVWNLGNLFLKAAQTQCWCLLCSDCRNLFLHHLNLNFSCS